MTHYKRLTFQHANLNRPVRIIAGTIAGYHFSEPTKCNVIYTTAGVFPVSETLEQIDQMIDSLNQTPIGQEKVNATEQAIRRPPVNVRKRKAR